MSSISARLAGGRNVPLPPFFLELVSLLKYISYFLIIYYCYVSAVSVPFDSAVYGPFGSGRVVVSFNTPADNACAAMCPGPMPPLPPPSPPVVEGRGSSCRTGA